MLSACYPPTIGAMSAESHRDCGKDEQLEVDFLILSLVVWCPQKRGPNRGREPVRRAKGDGSKGDIRSARFSEDASRMREWAEGRSEEHPGQTFGAASYLVSCSTHFGLAAPFSPSTQPNSETIPTCLLGRSSPRTRKNNCFFFFLFLQVRSWQEDTLIETTFHVVEYVCCALATACSFEHWRCRWQNGCMYTAYRKHVRLPTLSETLNILEKCSSMI